MSVRRAKAWVWWLLPLLVARALLPIGFMPSVGEHSLKLVICSAGFAKTVDTNPLQPAHKDSSQHGALTCPFAQIGTFGLSFVTPTLLSTFVILGLLGFSCWQEPKLTRFFRFSFARGPPASA